MAVLRGRMTDTPKTIEVIKPCPHESHNGEPFERKAKFTGPFCPGDDGIYYKDHEGAEVITLTEEIERPGIFRPQATEWVRRWVQSEWEDV